MVFFLTQNMASSQYIQERIKNVKGRRKDVEVFSLPFQWKLRSILKVFLTECSPTPINQRKKKKSPMNYWKRHQRCNTLRRIGDNTAPKKSHRTTANGVVTQDLVLSAVCFGHISTYLLTKFWALQRRTEKPSHTLFPTTTLPLWAVTKSSFPYLTSRERQDTSSLKNSGAPGAASTLHVSTGDTQRPPEQEWK